MARGSTAAAVEKIVHKACEETRRLEETMVYVFNVKVDSMIFDGAAMKESRGLHLALSLRKNEKTGHRFLLTPVIKGIVDGSEGHQRCIFNVRYELDILWEGCDMLTLSVYQHNLFLANTLLGSCEMPLSLCYEQLVSSAKSCNPGEAEPLAIEMELNLTYQSKPVIGRCGLFVSCRKEPLRLLGGRGALCATVPAPAGAHRKIHSEAIRRKMEQIHECQSICSQLQEAQADLWMHGVERLTTEGALDSNTIQVARACGLVSAERAELLRQGAGAQSKLASRSGSFTELPDTDHHTKWLRFCSV